MERNECGAGQSRRAWFASGVATLAAAAQSCGEAAAAPASQTSAAGAAASSEFLIAARPRVERVQIVFADFVPELVAASTTVPPATLCSSAGILALAAEKLGMPMTFCVVPVAGRAGCVIPELTQYSNETNTFSRAFTNPFLDARFVKRLEEQARPTIVVAGYSAETAVLLTALDALAQGYAVHVPVDCIGSRSARTEAVAIRQIELAGGVPTSLRSLLMRLAPNISKGPDAEVFKALSKQQ